jgi:hypothetical protein
MHEAEDVCKCFLQLYAFFKNNASIRLEEVCDSGE